MTPINADTPLKAWGVAKKVAEWARSPVCQVGIDELCRRLNDGMSAEVAIASPVLPTRPTPEPTPLSKIPFAERPAEAPKRVRGKKLSRYIGVSKRQGKWYAQVRLTRFNVKYLGEFPNEMAAALAYDAAAKPLGKRLNFPGRKPADTDPPPSV